MGDAKTIKEKETMERKDPPTGGSSIKLIHSRLPRPLPNELAVSVLIWEIFSHGSNRVCLSLEEVDRDASVAKQCPSGSSSQTEEWQLSVTQEGDCSSN